MHDPAPNSHIAHIAIDSDLYIMVKIMPQSSIASASAAVQRGSSQRWFGLPDKNAKYRDVTVYQASSFACLGTFSDTGEPHRSKGVACTASKVRTP